MKRVISHLKVFIFAFLLIGISLASAVYISNYDFSTSPLFSPSYSCNYDWNCPSGLYCNSGSCGEQYACSNENNYRCPSGQTCDKDDEKCKQIQCYSNSFSCISSPFKVCSEGLCKLEGCAKDSDCPSDTKCNLEIAGGVCFKPMCNSDIDCSGGLAGKSVCWNNLCLKRECNLNSDCSSSEVCNAGLCVEKECSLDRECLADEICYDGLCKEKKCLSDNDCPLGSLCNRNQCEVKFCTKDSECQIGRTNAYCLSGYCSLAECNVNSDCTSAPGLKCENKACVMGAEICNDNIDNDNNGYIDFADSSCASSCVITKSITYTKLGQGEGKPNMLSEDATSAGCCSSNQCYSKSGGCVNNGAVISINIGPNREASFCRVNGESAVWCKQAINNGKYINDGNGNCVLESDFGQICSKDSDCPTIMCVRAPCPVNKCESGICKTVYDYSGQVCSITAKCPSGYSCSKLIGGVCYKSN